MLSSSHIAFSFTFAVYLPVVSTQDIKFIGRLFLGLIYEGRAKFNCFIEKYVWNLSTRFPKKTRGSLEFINYVFFVYKTEDAEMCLLVYSFTEASMTWNYIGNTWKHGNKIKKRETRIINKKEA